MERNEKQGLCYLITATKVERIPEKDRIAFIYNDKNNFKCTVPLERAVVGERFIYFEVDSMIPLDFQGEKEELNDMFSFLKVSCQKNAKYAVIRARKMKDVVSMGLAIPLSEASKKESLNNYIKEGHTDLTQFFELKKYEPPLANGGQKCVDAYNALYHGKRSYDKIPLLTYPSELTDKSDEENLYNLEKCVITSYLDKECYMTLKMDGTSTTLQVKYDEKGEGTYYIFGHSILSDNTHMYKYFSETLDKDGLNIFDQMVKYHKEKGYNMLVCGEFYGPKIQGNPYKIDGYAFDVYKIVLYKDDGSERRVVNLKEMKEITNEIKATTVPIIKEGTLIDICKSLGYLGEKEGEDVRNFLYEIVEKLCFTDNHRDYNLDEKGMHHEGLVITSVEGHSDSLKGNSDKGWSFKIKGLKYQAR